MQYSVTFVDGSEEVVEARDISQARTKAAKLYNCSIQKVVAVGDDCGGMDDDEEDDEEDENE